MVSGTRVADKTLSAAEQAALIVLAIAITVGLQYAAHRAQRWVLSLPKPLAAYLLDFVNPTCAPGTVPIRQGLGYVCVVGYRP